MSKGKIYQVDYEFAADHNIADRTAQRRSSDYASRTEGPRRSDLLEIQ